MKITLVGMGSGLPGRLLLPSRSHRAGTLRSTWRMPTRSRGMAMPSVAEVILMSESRWPSAFWVGVRAETSRLSTTAPTTDPTAAPMGPAMAPPQRLGRGSEPGGSRSAS